MSECRNPALQRMFLLIGGGERAGSGADKIRAGWRVQHWRTPRLEVTDQPDRVVLTLPMVSLIPEDALRALRLRFWDAVDSLPPAEVQALATAWLEGAVSNTRLQQLLADHPVDITHMLAGLCEAGYLVSDKRRRWTTYRLPGDGAPEPSLFGAVDSPRQAPSDSSHLGIDSSHLGTDSSRSEAVEKTLQEIAEPVACRGKVSTELMGHTVCRLCGGRFLTAEELGRLLNRSAANLRSRHLSRLVRDGRLRPRFPEATNRPDQAYTTVEGRE
ncbi:MAG: hypothetical protein HY812_11420 [Planctomycetes bacterium]|nr:hypothetical protein [Planctomycetota bacterium]